MSEPDDVHVENCFGCSQGNPIGLKMRFTLKDETVLGKFISNENHEGPPGFVHGGIIGAVIDESSSFLARSLTNEGILTAKQEIKFKNPVKVGETIYVESFLKQQKRGAVIVTSKVYTNSNVIAEATGVLFKV